MFVTFNLQDGDLANLLVSIDGVHDAVYWPSLPAGPEVKNPHFLFISLHALRQNIDTVLSRAEFCER